MTAQVIDLIAARERLGHRAAARRQVSSGTALEQSKGFWLADLERWPGAAGDDNGAWFADVIHDMTEPDVVIAPFHERYRFHPRVNLRERRAAESIPVDMADWLNRAGRPSPVSWWDWQTRLAFEIWSWGRPERLVQHRIERVRKAIPAKRAGLARLHETLATGLIQIGPRKGQRVQLIERTRGHAETRVKEIAALEWELAHVLEWARRHPLDYALGKWPQRLVRVR